MVKAQCPELEVATAHAQSPHGDVGRELRVGWLAAHLVPAGEPLLRPLGSFAKLLCCIRRRLLCSLPLKKWARLMCCLLRLHALLLLAPVVLATTGRPVLVQRVTRNTCRPCKIAETSECPVPHCCLNTARTVPYGCSISTGLLLGPWLHSEALS